LSDFIEKNRSVYYDNLIRVTEKNDMEQWLKFFLTGIIETSKNATETFNRIIALREKLESEKIITLGKRIPNAKALLNFLYSKPNVTVADVIRALDLSKPTANALINDFQNLGILQEQTGFRRNRNFIFTEYLKLFER
jgi:Fic family protein